MQKRGSFYSKSSEHGVKTYIYDDVCNGGLKWTGYEGKKSERIVEMMMAKENIVKVGGHD